MAIALPGEVKGLFEVWKQHGRLEWRDLVTPSIQISRDGFNMGFALAKQAKEKEKFIRNSQGLRFAFKGEYFYSIFLRITQFLLFLNLLSKIN